jgi:hypothetical protein
VATEEELKGGSVEASGRTKATQKVHGEIEVANRKEANQIIWRRGGAFRR